MKICLRRLGLRYTGPEGEEEVKVQGTAQERQLVNQVVEHKRVAALVEELQERWGTVGHRYLSDYFFRWLFPFHSPECFECIFSACSRGIEVWCAP